MSINTPNYADVISHIERDIGSIAVLNSSLQRDSFNWNKNKANTLSDNLGVLGARIVKDISEARQLQKTSINETQKTKLTNLLIDLKGGIETMNGKGGIIDKIIKNNPNLPENRKVVEAWDGYSRLAEVLKDSFIGEKDKPNQTSLKKQPSRPPPPIPKKATEKREVTRTTQTPPSQPPNRPISPAPQKKPKDQ